MVEHVNGDLLLLHQLRNLLLCRLVELGHILRHPPRNPHRSTDHLVSSQQQQQPASSNANRKKKEEEEEEEEEKEESGISKATWP